MQESCRVTRKKSNSCSRDVMEHHEELGGWPPEEGVDFLTFRHFMALPFLLP